MELVFIRHGQGDHTLDLPKSLQLKDPSLTAEGIKQAKLLRNQFPLANEDILIISPIRRTLQTALIWSENIKCRKIVHPLVSPRIFPHRSSGNTLPCDTILDLETIQTDFPNFEIEQGQLAHLWSEGINVLPESHFIDLAEGFINWCRQLQKERVYIVSHDGTITSYRQMISGEKLTREDFPQETGWFQLNC